MNRPYNEFYNIRRGDQWSPVFLFAVIVYFRAAKRLPYKRTRIIVGEGLPLPCLCITTFLATRVSVVLTAVRSWCGSNTTLWCFSLPPRRFATLISCDSTSEVLPRVDCLSVCNDFIFDTFVRVLFGGVQGDLFREKGPPANLLNYSAK